MRVFWAALVAAALFAAAFFVAADFAAAYRSLFIIKALSSLSIPILG